MNELHDSGGDGNFAHRTHVHVTVFCLGSLDGVASQFRREDGRVALLLWQLCDGHEDEERENRYGCQFRQQA